MKKIVLVGSFALSDDQKVRLEAAGEVTETESPQTDAEWLEAVKDADVICSWGDHVLENADKLHDTLITYPYTELGAFDADKLAANNVYIANAKGGNRKSIAEWAMFEILSLFRQFPTFLRTTTQHEFTSTQSLEGKKVTIVGHGTIGTEVGERCEAFGMEVRYFNRGDDLHESVKEADVVVNALNCNSSTKNMLDKEFFMGLKQGAYYVTFSRPWTYDIDGLIAAIDVDIVARAGIDCDPEPLFDISNDFYKKCMSNEKILVTPHVAGVTKQAASNGVEIMIQNVEKYLSGNPQNVINKR